jgi:hypothetical protein
MQNPFILEQIPYSFCCRSSLCYIYKHIIHLWTNGIAGLVTWWPYSLQKVTNKGSCCKMAAMDIRNRIWEDQTSKIICNILKYLSVMVCAFITECTTLFFFELCYPTTVLLYNKLENHWYLPVRENLLCIYLFTHTVLLYNKLHHSKYMYLESECIPFKYISKHCVVQ